MPVPNQEAEAAASRSLSAMRAGGFLPAPHAAHLVVASTSPTAAALDRLLRHTRVVAAFAKASHATGIYEGNAHATHDPSFYVDVASDGSLLPLMIWNGISIANTADTVELLTLGMEQLGLRAGPCWDRRPRSSMRGRAPPEADWGSRPQPTMG